MDLGNTYLVEAIALQRASGKVTKYNLHHSIDGVNFETYGELDGVGSSTTNYELQRQWLTSFSARYVRVEPTAWSGSIGMSFEVYGSPIATEPYFPGIFGEADYEFEAKMSILGRRSWGVAFRYQDRSNHYELRGRTGLGRSLVRNDGIPLKVKASNGRMFESDPSINNGCENWYGEHWDTGTCSRGRKCG